MRDCSDASDLGFTESDFLSCGIVRDINHVLSLIEKRENVVIIRRFLRFTLFTNW